MNTDDAREILSQPDKPHGWQPLTVQEIAADLQVSHPQIEVLRFHAQGGMGAIYHGLLHRDLMDGGQVQVAIKVLRPDAADDAEFVKRFRREQAVLHDLDHPGIPRHHLSGETADGHLFLVMDWVKGTPLNTLTTPGSTTDRSRILSVMADICAPVRHAHDKGIIHRDLKPANVVVDKAGRATVLDFGIARRLGTAHTLLTNTGVAPGTVDYIAPEVLEGRAPDVRSDVYALGIILYQLLMKQVPRLGSKTPSEASLDPRFDQVYRKAVATDPQDRFQSVQELEQAIAALQANGTTARDAKGKLPPPAPEDIVFEYEYNWLTLRRQLPGGGVIERVFCSEFLVDELFDILGLEYQVSIKREKILQVKEEDTETVRIYYWPHLGVIASAQRARYLNGGKYEWGGDETRWQRIYSIELLLKAPHHGPFLDSLSPSVKIQSFKGEFLVLGVKIQHGWTPDNFTAVKQGVAFRRWSEQWVGRRTSIMIAATSDSEGCESATNPITRLQVKLEEWTHPLRDFTQMILEPDEVIFNSMSSIYGTQIKLESVEREIKYAITRERSGFFKRLFLRFEIKSLVEERDYLTQKVYGDDFFALMVTNKHLFLKLPQTSEITKVNLRENPRIECYQSSYVRGRRVNRYRLTFSGSAGNDFLFKDSGYEYMHGGYSQPMEVFIARLDAAVRRYENPLAPEVETPLVQNSLVNSNREMEALIACKACTKPVAKEARVCPHCGALFSPNRDLQAISTTLYPHLRAALREGEVPVFATRLHWSIFLPWCFMACIMLFTASIFLGPAALLLAGACLIPPLIQYLGSEFAITDSRVVIRQGILNLMTTDKQIISIPKVEVKQTWLDRLLERGPVMLSGTGGESETLDCLADPGGFRDALLMMQQRLRQLG